MHRLDASLRYGRETWWAEVSPREEYSPRCSCCPLLLDHTTASLVALDVESGVCVHVEHLGGDHAGRGFSMRIRSRISRLRSCRYRTFLTSLPSGMGST